MYRLSPIILLLGLTINSFAQNPHGVDFKTDCATCHTSAGWEISSDFWSKNDPSKPMISTATGLALPNKSRGFDHNTTEFTLESQHAVVDCRECHQTLVFSEARTDCISCHTDMHQQTVGVDCARCHNSENWFVDDITELHYENGFPLLGAHTITSCYECHKSASELAFYRIGNECINCHSEDYSATISPNHSSAGFSTNCIECHNIYGLDWTSENINHDFFPLNKGHEIEDCAKCHTSGGYSNTSTDCFSCHQEDYIGAINPNHQSQNFPTECTECHTTDPEWMPAKFLEHDSHFPIYSGEHNGEWDNCLDCHSNPSNYSEVTCTTCHSNPETDNEHSGIGGYSYNSQACLACHPNGTSDDSFNHNLTNFPLTGVHFNTECIECHSNGYAGTPTDCAACHITDFNQTINPNHNALAISTDCASCHTPEPEWNPAAFANHNDYHALNGAHAAIATDCAVCHNGEYNNTPNTCVGCHLDEYNTTIDPSHTTLQFSTDCATCHSENVWQPATFDHDGQYFPIYSGSHIGEWEQCLDCHTNPSNYAEVSCTICHANPETDGQHIGITGYSFSSPACLACHPTGMAEDNFDHNLTNFPLTGVHITTECIDCHTAGYAGTPSDCASCHTTDFNQTINPNHNVLGISTDCASCHTTEPDWDPASFANHNDYHALNGAHAAIAIDCAACHNGDYNNTPNTCVGCHLDDYNNTTDPNHTASQFSTDCASCHTENAWQPATFDHNLTNFPLTGEHITTECIKCHTDSYAGTPTDCAACHTTDFNQTINPNHNTIGISTDCASCHTTEPEWNPANFANHNDYYALNGAHTTIATDCATCHNGDYNNTPNTCVGCHLNDYNTTTNPNHSTAQFPTDCESCHTESSWEPSTFDHDAQYFPIYSGKHSEAWDQCIECHTTQSSFSVFSCIDCHEHTNQADLADKHSAVAGYTYTGISCFTCHPTGDN